MKRIAFFLLFANISASSIFAQIGVEDKIKPLVVGGKVADAVDVETTGNSDAQTDLDNLGGSILNWQFNGLVTDASNPGAGFLSINNALKDDATILSFHVQSSNDNARFTTLLRNLPNGSLIWLQERVTENNSILYQVNADPPHLLDGTKVNVPIQRSLDQGGEFTNNNVLNVKIWPLGFADASNTQTPGNEVTEFSEGLRDFNNHITVAGIQGGPWTAASNPTQLNTTVTRLYAALWDENRTGASPFTGNYFDDLTDPTEVFTDLFYFADGNDLGNANFPGKQSYITGNADISSATTFANTSTKIIGFSHYIRDETFTGEVSLLKLGSREVLSLTSSGLVITVGNSDGTLVSASFDQRLTQLNSGFTIQYLGGVGADNTQWFVPERNPSQVALTFPLTLSLRLKAIDNGVTGPVKIVEYTITDRDIAQPQTSQVVAVNVPGGGTRDETLLFSYDVPGNILNVGTAGLALNATNEVSRLGFEVTYNDSRQINSSATTSRVPFFQQDEHTGREVDILLMFEATNPSETSADKFLTVKAIINGFQENDVNLHLRESDYDFTDYQFGPDAGDQVAISNIQIYEWDDSGEPFDAPTHNQLHNMWLRRNDWLGLFRHPSFNSRNYTVDGGMILTDENATLYDIIERFKGIRVTEVYRALNTGTSTNGLVNVIGLPADFDQYNFVHISERDPGPPVEWRHTVIDTSLLASGLLGLTDNIRVQGNTDLTWTPGTRGLAIATGEQEIYSVILIDLEE